MWWINSIIKKLYVSCWTAYILQDDTQSLQYQVDKCVFNIALSFCKSLHLSMLLQLKNSFSCLSQHHIIMPYALYYAITTAGDSSVDGTLRSRSFSAFIFMTVGWADSEMCIDMSGTWRTTGMQLPELRCPPLWTWGLRSSGMLCYIDW